MEFYDNFYWRELEIEKRDFERKIFQWEILETNIKNKGEK